MNQAKTTTAAVLLAGLLAGAGAAQAQTAVTPAEGAVVTTTGMGAPGDYGQPQGRVVPRSTASVTSNVPVQAGEASTMTNGVPNMATYNANPDDGRVVYPRPTEIARVPQQAGEASTMVNGRPNWNPNDPVIRRQQERAMGYGTVQPWQVPGGTPD